MKLTESQAWEKIAIEFHEKTSMGSFICHHFKHLYENDLIHKEMYNKIHKIIMEDVDLYNGEEVYNHFANSGDRYHKEWSLLRADYCWLQKCICETREK